MANRLMAAVAALAFASSGAALAAPPPAGSVYVSMGSSFAAGPKIGSPEPGGAARCGRSSVNYANLIAARYRLKLVDRGCGGGTTLDVLSHDQAGEGPQLSAVTADARLVTLLIGGNDVNYLGSLNASSCLFLASRPGGQPCAAKTPVLAPEADFKAVTDNIVEIARQVHVRAPQARLIVIDYQAILSPDTTCAATQMSPESLARERTIGRKVGEAIDAGAKAAGAELLRIGELSQGHDACSADPWIAGYPADGQAAEASYTPYHPNAKGMQMIAAALEAMIEKPGP